MTESNPSKDSIVKAKNTLANTLGTNKSVNVFGTNSPINTIGTNRLISNPTKYNSAAYSLAAPKVINNSINSTFGAGTHRTSDLMRARMKADDSIVNPYTGQSGYAYDTNKPFQQFYKDLDKIGLWYDGLTESAGDRLADITYKIGKNKGESREDYHERVRPVSQTAADFSMSLLPIFGNVTGIGEGFQDMTEAFDGYDRATGQKLNAGQRAARGAGGAIFTLLSAMPGGKAVGSTGKLALKAGKNEAKLAFRAKQLEEAAAKTRLGNDAVETALAVPYSDNAIKAAIKDGFDANGSPRSVLVDPDVAKTIEENLKEYGGLAGRTEKEEVAAVDKAIYDKLHGKQTPEKVTEAVRKNEKPSDAQKAVGEALDEIPVNVGSSNVSRYETLPSDNLLSRMETGARNSADKIKGVPGIANRAMQGIIGKGQRAGKGVLGAIDGALDPTSTFGKRNKQRLDYAVRDKENPIDPERFAKARRGADIDYATRGIDKEYQGAINAALNGVEAVYEPHVKRNLMHIANIKRNGLEDENAAKAAHLLYKGTPAEDAAKAREAVEGGFEEFDSDDINSLLALLGDGVYKKEETAEAVKRFFENLDKDKIDSFAKAQSKNDPGAYKDAFKELRGTGFRTNADALPANLSKEEFARETKGFDAAKTKAARRGEWEEFADKVLAGTEQSDRRIQKYLNSSIPGESETRKKQVKKLVEEFKKSKYADMDKLDEALDILGPIIPDAAHMNVADLEQLRRILGDKTFNILFTKLEDGFAKTARNKVRPAKQATARKLYDAGITGNLPRTAASVLATGLSMAGQPYQDKFSSYKDSVVDAGEGIAGAHMLPGALIWAALAGGRRFGPNGANRFIDAANSHVRRNRVPMAFKSIADESDRNRYISEDDIMDEAEMNEYLESLASARDERIMKALGN